MCFLFAFYCNNVFTTQLDYTHATQKIYSKSNTFDMYCLTFLRDKLFYTVKFFFTNI